MKTLPALLLAALFTVSGAAFAGQADYTATASKIDAMMSTGKHTPTTTDEFRKLRADSDRMMKEGKEAEAMALLEKAKKLLEAK